MALTARVMKAPQASAGAQLGVQERETPEGSVLTISVTIARGSLQGWVFQLVSVVPKYQQKEGYKCNNHGIK